MISKLIKVNSIFISKGRSQKWIKESWWKIQRNASQLQRKIECLDTCQAAGKYSENTGIPKAKAQTAIKRPLDVSMGARYGRWYCRWTLPWTGRRNQIPIKVNKI